MESPEKRLPWAWILGLAALACLPVLGGTFNFDDVATVLRNSHLEDWAATLRYFGAVSGRPLFHLSLYLDHALWGRHPAGYHLTNLLIHLAVTALLAGLARDLAGRRAGVAAGLLFGLHPLAASAACYVSARSELLAAAFSLLTLRALVGGRLVVASVCWVLALLSKESAAALPACALALLPLFPGERRRRTAAWGLAACTLAAAGALWLLPRLVLPAERLPWDRYAPAGIAAAGHYLRLWILPFGQSADADALPSAFAASLLLPATLLLSWRCSPRAAGALGAAFLALAPTSLAPLLDPVQEYRAFLASAFLALAAAPWLSPRKLGILAVLGLSLTAARAGAWRSEAGLWQEGLRLSPRKLRIHANLMTRYWGYALAARTAGDASRAERLFDAAERTVLRAIRIRERSEQHRDLARIALERGNERKARAALDRALALEPGRADCLAILKRIGEARRGIDAAR